MRQLLWDTLRYADLQTLHIIEADVQVFSNRAVDIVKNSNDENMNWLELIPMIEWQTELQNALSQSTLEKDHLRYVTDYAKRNPFSFDPRLVLSGF